MRKIKVVKIVASVIKNFICCSWRVENAKNESTEKALSREKVLQRVEDLLIPK